MKRVYNGIHITGWLTTAYEINGTKIDGQERSKVKMDGYIRGHESEPISYVIG